MFSGNKGQLNDTPDVHYFKLPHIASQPFANHIKNKRWKFCKEFSQENFSIKLVFNSFKIKKYF